MTTELRNRTDLYFIGKAPAYFGSERDPVFKNVTIVEKTRTTVTIEYAQRGKIFKDTFPLNSVIISEWEETEEGATKREELTAKRKATLQKKK